MYLNCLLIWPLRFRHAKCFRWIFCNLKTVLLSFIVALQCLHSTLYTPPPPLLVS